MYFPQSLALRRRIFGKFSYSIFKIYEYPGGKFHSPYRGGGAAENIEIQSRRFSYLLSARYVPPAVGDPTLSAWGQKLSKSSTDVFLIRNTISVLCKKLITTFIFQLIVNISVQSTDGLAACVESDLLPNLLNEVQGKDILIQLTALETITKLALCDHGFQFLKEKGLLKYLQQQLNDPCELHPLLLPGNIVKLFFASICIVFVIFFESTYLPTYFAFFEGYIKFFGNVAQVRPQEIFSEYHSVMDLVFQLYHSDDPVISNIALETIGFICSNPAGKQALSQYGKSLRHVVT